jgi:hypothetical protein
MLKGMIFKSTIGNHSFDVLLIINLNFINDILTYKF